MSRWSEAFATLSSGADTLDTMRHSGLSPRIVSQTVNSVTAPTPTGDRPLGSEDEADAKGGAKAADRPVEPLLLRDGRRLYRFAAETIPERTPVRAMELIEEVYWRGAVLVADGADLIVVERWLGALPVEMLEAIHDCAAEVIAVLRQQSLARCAARKIVDDPT